MPRRDENSPSDLYFLFDCVGAKKHVYFMKKKTAQVFSKLALKRGDPGGPESWSRPLE